MNLNFLYKSYDHVRYENGKHVSGPTGGANRAVKVEPNISGNEGFTVTLYNLDGNHSLWQNNVQMSPKQMKITEQTLNMVVLRGYGFDMMGGAFADYGLTIFFQEGEVEKCILHLHDRNVDIEYLKAGRTNEANPNQVENGLELLKSFLVKWINVYPMDVKRSIAIKTDELNNEGVSYYQQGDIERAIYYFNEAIEVMPINEDALKNLIICYRRTGKYKEQMEIEEQLDYIKSMIG